MIINLQIVHSPAMPITWLPTILLAFLNSLKFDYKAGVVADEETMQEEFITQYNSEIDAAVADIDAGNFVLHEDVEKLFAISIGSVQSSQLSALFLLTLITGILTGTYPALYLSGFKPLATLKRKLEGKIGEFLVRKGLVVFQFVVSFVLIVSVLIVYRQIEFARNKSIGYQKEHVVYFNQLGVGSGVKNKKSSAEQQMT